MCPEGVLNWKKHPSFLLMPNVQKLRRNSKNISLKIGTWGPQKLSQIFNMPIIKSVAQKGQNTPKSDFGGPKTPQRCEFDMKHVLLYVGHMYKPFWTKKIWLGWQGGSGKVKIMHLCTFPIEMTQMCHILTFPGPSCRPGQIFLVKNGLYMCPTYSTTCFMSNSHLWGVF